jgi:outer membrane protein assembly factor BamB
MLQGQSFPDPPVVQDGVVYTSAEGFGTTVYAIRETDGTQLWAKTLFAGGPVTLAGNTVVSVGGCSYVWG